MTSKDTTENPNHDPMITLLRTTSDHEDFQRLVRHLDAELAVIDGDDHAFYHQFNKTDALKYVVLAYDDQHPVGCGALKAFDAATMEVKRMFVFPEMRGHGIATRVLAELEHWAKELHLPKCVLETGKKQPDAIALYTKNGYNLIPNYGQYAGIENSVCFEKQF